MRSLLLLLLSLFFASLSVAAAQNVPACPVDVLLALSRAASTCYGLEGEQICLGNGAGQAVDFEGNVLVAQPGDRADLAQIQHVILPSEGDALSIALLTLRADLPDRTERDVTVIALGDVQLTNHVEPLPQLNAVATGNVNIRRSPSTNAEIIARGGVNDGLILNGRTRDSLWLRARIPNSPLYGWVSVESLNVRGDLHMLRVFEGGEITRRAFESLSLETGGTTFCDGALPSGVIVQTPSVDQAVTLTIDDTRVQLAGTFWLRHEDETVLSMLAGRAVIGEGDETAFVPAGAAVTVASAGVSAPQPIDPMTLEAVPLHLLPVSVRLSGAITEDDIARLTDAYAAELAAAAVTPEAVSPLEDTTCRRDTLRQVVLYAGPGDFYEAINSLEAGSTVTPILQTTDPDGRTWWQLRNSNWILAAYVRTRGECEPVPVSQVVTPPRENTLSLETCETTNGPLRAGQSVRIQFSPPPWDNYGEARDAPIIDPGRITIGARTYYARATEPMQIGTAGVDDRYIRRFYMIWDAVPGTHRIVGDRLTYEPICTITVPVG